MRYNQEHCIELPNGFPFDEFSSLMATARHVLLGGSTVDQWKEFAVTSNLIAWRYRARRAKIGSYIGIRGCDWGQMSRTKKYINETVRSLGCSLRQCLASKALSTQLQHPQAIQRLSIPFTAAEQRACSPKRLLGWLRPVGKAAWRYQIFCVLRRMELSALG